MRRQAFHDPPDVLDRKVAECRRLNLGGSIGHLLRQLLTHGLVAEMVGHGVGRDPVEPAGKRPAGVPIPAYAPKSVEEDLGRYVFGCRRVTETCTDETVDPINVTVIEEAEGVGVRLRALNQKALILVHAVEPNGATKAASSRNLLIVKRGGRGGTG
jgi:hypothetical protein